MSDLSLWLLFGAGFLFVLFVGGLFGNSWDAAERRRERRARSQDGPRWR